jgi:hypothetical protein
MDSAQMGQVIPFAGFAVQWLRGQKNIPEWATLLVQVTLGVTAYWLVHKTVGPDVWQTIMLTIGSTQVASSLSNMGVAPIPQTNSR